MKCSSTWLISIAMPCLRQLLHQRAGADDLAVDQDAVAIEDDECDHAAMRADDSGDRLAELGVLAGLEMHAVGVAGADDGAGIEERGAVFLRLRAIGGAEALRLLRSAMEHVAEEGELGERRRRDQQHARRRVVRAGAGLRDGFEQDADQFRDVQRMDREARLEVVGAEHQGHEVDRPMALQARAQVPRGRSCRRLRSGRRARWCARAALLRSR